MRDRARDGRRETRATAVDRLAAKLSTQRGTPLSGGDVARMRPEERRRLLMRLGYLDGRASTEQLRAALASAEEPPRPATARGRGRAVNEAREREDESGRDADQHKRGRPPMPEGEARTVRVEVRLTPAEYQRLLDQVDEDMPSVSEVVRRRAVG